MNFFWQNMRNWSFAAALALLLGYNPEGQTKVLDLQGYITPSGAITTRHQGDAIDPYFALQALLLAQSHALDVDAIALPWVQWLQTRYLAEGHLGRYCKAVDEWLRCQSADADDASLALWLKFLAARPAHERHQLNTASLETLVRKDLARLKNKRTGLYHVSLEIPHSLLMDNLEVWSVLSDPTLAQAIERVFWDKKNKRFKISTQAQHQDQPDRFYPEAAAQIYPMLLGWSALPGGAAVYYQQWMKKNRQVWLAHAVTDFPWGVIALLAFEQGDLGSVRCWQIQAMPQRHTTKWTVTDEVVAQILPPWPEPSPVELTKEDCK